MTPSALREAASAVLELERRRKSYPLAYSALWDNPEPRTSQRRAVALSRPGVLLTAVLGGNRAGKSDLLAQWTTAQAAGLDAVHEGPEGRVEYVRRWLARNCLPESIVPLGPGRVWTGSPTYSAAREQIRPKLMKLAPEGTRLVSWTADAEGELRYPNGGVVVSKAYRQYDADQTTWEGANLRAVSFDEQPRTYANMVAAFSRLVDQSGRAMIAVTDLNGKAGWLYREIVHKPPAWARVTYLHGGDNPHIPQEMRDLMLAAVPAWQRATRDTGAITSPAGAIFSFDRGVHLLAPFAPPPSWTRWMGVDWGARAPHVVWAAECPAAYTLPDGRTLVAGDLVVYRELGPRRSTLEPGISQRKLLKWVEELENGQPEGLGHSTIYRVADSEDPGAIAEAAEFGLWLEGAQKEAGSVLLGLNLLEALFQTVDGVTLEPTRPRLYVTSDCPVLIEELEGMRWGEQREGADPKPDPACPDHGTDALRYLVRYRQSMGFR